MRPFVLAIGAVLMIAGIIGYTNFDGIVSECQSSVNKMGMIGGDFREICAKLPSLENITPVIVIVGLGLLGYGVVAKKKIKIEEPVEEKEEIPSAVSTDSDYVKLAKRFEDISEKHEQLEKKYTKLMTHLRRNGIDLPDYLVAKAE